MAELHIPPDPIHFTVWYNYYANQMPGLTRALDELEKAGRCDAAACLEVYVKFWGDDTQTDLIHKTNASIETAVGHVLEHLNQAGANASGYSSALAGFSSRLSANPTADHAMSAIEDIVSVTRQMEEKTKVLENRLVESSREISELKETLASVRHEAMTDALTGIANRKRLDFELHKAMTVATETGGPTCLLLLDIDHFKKFNDTYGHQLGDQVLKLVARSLTESIKGRDIAARYGGEEFAIVLPQTALRNACTVAEQIRAAIASKQIVKKSTGKKLAKITVSVGVAQYRPTEPLGDFIRRADEALYLAKRDGRNRVATEGKPKLSLVANS
ncbi:MAG: GGDEF domain-containing protein [Alphaproteobacteria bacterium]